ncbi:hypothetical protein JST97_25105 [bacterium]|nr:hypothetical protein [bacterium]
MNLRRLLVPAWVLGLFCISLGLHRQVDRARAEANLAIQRLERIKQDQPDLLEIRERARQVQLQTDLLQSLRHQSRLQAQLLEALSALDWTYLEWEREGFYLEAKSLDRIKSLYPAASLETNRMACPWP